MSDMEKQNKQETGGEENFDTFEYDTYDVYDQSDVQPDDGGQQMNQPNQGGYYMGQGMNPNMNPNMRPGMGQGMNPNMRPDMGRGMNPNMRPGMGQGMMKPQRKKDDTPEAVKFIRTMFSRKIVLVGVIVFSIFALMAIFAPVIARYEPASMDYKAILQMPSAEHWLGTDNYGRDTFARIVYGARISLVIGVVAVSIAAIVGISLGLIAGYFGGVVDVIISRVMEALNAIPNVMLSLALIAVVGNSILDMAVVLSVVTIPSYVRMTRSMTLSQKNSDSVKAAEMAGASSFYVIVKHILPNVMSPNIIMIMSNVGTTILLESGLSFLGVGISIPTPSWGSMVADGRAYLLSNPYVSIIPGLCVALLVISLNLMGDGIRDAMDPRLRGMH